MEDSNKLIITVLMSVFNEPLEWLTKSIDSVLNQTYKDFEFIIVIDNPKAKDIIVLLENYRCKDSRIFLVYNKENLGLTKSLNIGLTLAKGKYIARMDADDIALPSRFFKQVNFLENNPEYVLCGSFVTAFDDNGTEFLIDYPTSDLSIKRRLYIDNCIAHPTIMFVNRIASDSGIVYNENYRYAQDYGLFVSLSLFGKFRVIDEPLLKYRVSENQISKSKLKQQTEFKRVIQENYLNISLSLYNLQLQDFNIPKKIYRNNEIPFHTKRYMLSSMYSLMSPIECISYPIIRDFTIFIMGKLYFSSCKRAILWKKISSQN